ncbi:MAG: mannitol dehydrogenase family protein [Chloroflexota bacterium]
MVRDAIVRLNEEALGAIAAHIETPAYDRRGLQPSITHLGVGAFHRAHQAVYLDDLAAMGSAWGERGVGLLPQDRGVAAALQPQQCLYTLLVRSTEGDTARIVGSLLEYQFAPEHPEAVLNALADASTRLVTMTITEGGYNVNETTGTFNGANEAVQFDLQHPHCPTTVFGYLAEAFDRRRKAGIAPCSVLSCDNVQANGHVTRTALVSFARLRDDALANWIEQYVAFPNSMVDRITPQTTDTERELVARDFGVADCWPVVTEPFRQWVVEDVFSDGRPVLEQAGVQMVTDVLPYETMKMRLLNASHVALGYLGYVAGYRTVDAVVRDKFFRTFITLQMRDEVVPLLPRVPGIDLDTYQRTLIERFSNPKIGDQLARICLDGSAKVPKFLLPALHDALDARRPHRWLTLALAGWLRYLAGVDDQRAEIVVKDARLAELQTLALLGRDDPRPLLGLRDLFGDLADCEEFVTDLSAILRALYARGVHDTLADAGSQDTLDQPDPAWGRL